METYIVGGVIKEQVRLEEKKEEINKKIAPQFLVCGATVLLRTHPYG